MDNIKRGLANTMQTFWASKPSTDDTSDDSYEDSLVSDYGEPISYVTKKVLCLTFNPNEFYEGMDGKIIESTLQFDKEYPDDWISEIRGAPVGSILRLPATVVSDASFPYGKTHFVKTSHFEKMFNRLELDEKMSTKTYYCMHGNSGVGKTHTLDVLCEVGKAKGLFVIHYSRGVYDDMWKLDEEKAGWYKRILVKRLVESNSEAVWRKYLRLPGNEIGVKLSENEKERENIYRNAKRVVQWREEEKLETYKQTAETYIKNLASQTLKDIYKALTAADERVLIVIDDINTLTKGQMRTTHEIPLQRLQRQQATGQTILDLCMDLNANPFHMATNVMMFVAASQHFHELERMGTNLSPVRIKPSTSIWDIMGITLFFYRYIRFMDNLKNASDEFCGRLARTCMIECGLLLRLLIQGTQDAAIKVDAENQRFTTVENRNGMVYKFLNAIKMRVDISVKQRYEEVFRSYFEKTEGKRIPIGFLQLKSSPEHRRMQRDFLLVSQSIFKKSTFSLVEHRNSPYFDTGIITETMKSSEDGQFGFVSNIARTAYGKQLADKTLMKTSPLEIKDGESSVFQERIEHSFRFRGFAPGENIRDYVESTKASVIDVPPAFMTVKLEFDYKKGTQKRKSNGDNLPPDNVTHNVTLKSIKFSDEDKKAFQTWMAGSNDISQSVLFVGKGIGGSYDMPAFDQVLVTKNVAEKTRNTFFYAFQNTLEQLQNGHISSGRFEKMKGNGIKLLSEIIQVGYGNQGYKVVLKNDEHFGVVDENNQAVDHTDVALFYVNPKGEARRGPSSKKPGFVLYVIGQKAVLESFRMEYKAPPVRKGPKKPAAKKQRKK